MTPREASPKPWSFVPDPDPAATNCGAIVDASGAVVCAVGWAGDDGWCSAPSPANMRAIVEAVNGESRAVLLAEANLERGLANLIEPYRAEVAELLADFWEAEAERARAGLVAGGTDALPWTRWYEGWYSGLDSTGIESSPITPDGIPVPRMVWWHAHRRTPR